MKRAFDLTPDVPQVGQVILDIFNLHPLIAQDVRLRKHATPVSFKPGHVADTKS